MKTKVYLFKNAAGLPVRAFTDAFFEVEPELAAKLCPVVTEELEPYAVLRDVADGEVAWLYAPYKIDEVTTVFFVEGGRCYVKKVMGRRARRWRRPVFEQHALDPVPIYKGPTAREVMTPAIACGDADEVKRQMISFLEELMKAYPPLRQGILPDCTFDAIPQNCIIGADGVYHFFDLEGDMKGGVPLAYLIYRIADTTLVRTPKNPGVKLDVKGIVADVDRHFGVEPDNKAHAAITKALKRYNTLCIRRVLTNIWISLLPFKSWKQRFRWWSHKPCLKGPRRKLGVMAQG